VWALQSSEEPYLLKTGLIRSFVAGTKAWNGAKQKAGSKNRALSGSMELAKERRQHHKKSR
jgi:hypothetical protein